MILYSQGRKQNDCREGDFDVRNGEYTQCQECGKIHQVDIKYNIENDLYVKIECPRCRGITTHLLCGDKAEDLYLTYNLNIDSRFYEYKTK